MSVAIPLAPGMVEGVPLARHTTLRVGGPARYYLESADIRTLGEGLASAVEAGLPVLVLGGGSNLLVAEGGFDGLAVKYTAGTFTVSTGEDGRHIVTAAAGLPLANLARKLAHQGWAGLEWASNVPGSIGGAAVNNAGAFGGCMAEDLVSLDLLRSNGTVAALANDELGYAYRTSVLKRGELGPILVTTVRCAVHRDESGAPVRRIVEYQQRRSASQPRQLSAGSVFANPPEDFAGRLIEAAGLKGARIGGAEISGQHANFIVNEGGATAADVYALVRLAQDVVWERARVWLRPEIQLVGSWGAAEVRALAGPTAESGETNRGAQREPTDG